MSNTRPVIGVVAQEAPVNMRKEFEGASSYIAASYVKAVEGSGARVVPVFLDQPDSYYRGVMQSINGLILPGGNTWLYKEDNVTPKDYGYLRAVEILYNEAKQMNKSKADFPILAICLGFEVLLFLEVGKKEIREVFSNGFTVKSPLRVDLQSNHLNDKLWKDCPDLSKEPICYFSHQFYITEETMKTNILKEKWDVIGTSKANVNNEEIKFVSIIESKEYPIIGVQFHPEKNAYEWNETLDIPHTERAIVSARFFFDWLVRIARGNCNKFTDKEMKLQSLITKFPKTPTKENKSFDELYLFDVNNDQMCNFCN